jgi:class 3 adenylate cyclase/tetratricopeptide (TPR) repeat protein
MEGERRVVSILFCDVQGSTEAAEKLDPEDWTEIMNGAFEHMIRPVYHYEGTVARLMGDAVLAFFGAPIAHEDDPQRAVLAGLDIVADMQSYRSQVKQVWDINFDIRVGINTGLVVVGAVGSDLRMEYTAMGDAINLAARMEQTAAPGTVQIAQDTYTQVAPFFIFEDLGGISVKGKDHPVTAYKVLGQKATPGRQRGISGLEAPLIGRARERSSLKQALSNLDQGLGGIVYLLGEAGLGKSRLIQEVRVSGLQDEGLKEQTAFWYQTASLSFETEQPYALFRRLVRRMLGVLPDESPVGMREKIYYLVEEAPQEERPTAQRVFESLFGLVGKNGEPPLEGETFKGLFYTMMASLWERRAQAGPVVLVCDDLHWTDPASAALLQNLYPLTNRAALLLVCAMRPERETPGWEAMQVAKRDFPQRYNEIHLQHLSASESGELVDSLLRISDLPVGLRNRIMDKSEGNPFFVEELVRSLIDQGVVVRDEYGARWQATSEGEDLDIPGNLQTLLVARIDRLAEGARRILQVASVVGRSFYYRILQRLEDLSEQELDHHLLSLQRMQLIQETRRLPELEYSFRHALTQEAAYSTILIKQRRVIHRQVGEALEALFPEQREELAGALAEHFYQARDFGNALRYYLLAGDAAFRLFATRESIKYYGRAIQCSEEVQASSEQLIHLYSRLGRAYELNNQFDQALRNYHDMARLADQRGDRAMRLASLVAEGTVTALPYDTHDLDRARIVSGEALALAKDLGDQIAEAKVFWNHLLIDRVSSGGTEQTIAYGRQAAEIARLVKELDLLATILNDLATIYIGIGDLVAGQEALEEAEKILIKLNNPSMLGNTYNFLGMLNRASGQFDRSIAYLREGKVVTEILGGIRNFPFMTINLCIPLLKQGHFDSALPMLKDLLALEEEPAPNDFLLVTTCQLMAQISLLLGANDLGITWCQKAIAYNDAVPVFVRQPTYAFLARHWIRLGDLSQAQVALNDGLPGYDPCLMPK